MNKEVIGAVLLGLVIGFGVFVGVRQIGRIMNWWQQQPNLKIEKEVKTMPIKEERIVKIAPTEQEGKKVFKIISPSQYFLVDKRWVDIKIQIASGSGILRRINDKVSFKVADKSSLIWEAKLESGANLIEIINIKEGLKVGQDIKLNGVVSNKKYPQGAKGLSGRLEKIKEDKIVVKADSGEVKELMVVPLSKIYGFDEEGRRATVTKLEKEFIGRPVIVIFGEDEKIIKLLLLRDLKFEAWHYFKGKVSKVDDDKGLYQLVDVKGSVKEIKIKIKGVKLYMSTGEEVTSDKIGLEDEVMLVYLGKSLKLAIVNPQTNLLER